MSESTDRVPASLPLESGTLIAERYKLTCRIGKGGMGEVWSARHVHLGVTHAIKFIAVTLLAAGEVERTLARFEGEARATSALSRASRHIVFVSDYGVHDGIPYLVMEHLEGEPLDALLTREQRLSPQRTLDILEQICRALTQAHKANLIHRDLKPANIFIGKDETGELLVKVLDFGICRSTTQTDHHLTQVGIALGTPQYMSPEQARAADDMDHQCDLWAMAVLGFRMLCGKVPWVGATMQDVLIAVCRSEFARISTVDPALGTGYDAFFDRAFQRNQHNRFPSGEALLQAFRACVRPMPNEEVPTTSFASTGRLTAPRHWSVKAFGVLGVFALTALTVGYLRHKSSVNASKEGAVAQADLRNIEPDFGRKAPQSPLGSAYALVSSSPTLLRAEVPSSTAPPPSTLGSASPRNVPPPIAAMNQAAAPAGTTKPTAAPAEPAAPSAPAPVSTPPPPANSVPNPSAIF